MFGSFWGTGVASALEGVVVVPVGGEWVVVRAVELSVKLSTVGLHLEIQGPAVVEQSDFVTSHLMVWGFRCSSSL